jgi:hypothetical protein
MRGWLFAAVLAAVAALLVVTRPAVADTGTSGLGINAGSLFTDVPSSLWSVHLSEMYRDGIRLVRTDAPWNEVEPARPTASGPKYDWASLDAIVRSLATYHLRWLPIADYSTSWAASQSTSSGANLFSAPTDIGAYAAYVRAIVARYGPDGAFWRMHPALQPQPITAIEIWNEENGIYWQPLPNPNSYSRLYQAARAAAHAADPRIEAIVGGLAVPADAFLKQLLTGSAGKSLPVDAVALHPYGLTFASELAQVTAARSLLDAIGDVNTPLDITEFGLPVEYVTLGGLLVGNSQLQAERAELLATTTTNLAESDCGVERILPYAWTTPEMSTANPQDWYGIVHPNGQPSASASAYAAALQALEARAPLSHATLSVCQRPLSLSLRSRTRRSLHPGTERRRTKRFSACAIATVTSQHAPVSSARVHFTAEEAGTRARKATVLSNISGEAKRCWSLRRGRVVITATASSADFVPVPVATVRQRVR